MDFRSVTQPRRIPIPGRSTERFDRDLSFVCAVDGCGRVSRAKASRRGKLSRGAKGGKQRREEQDNDSCPEGEEAAAAAAVGETEEATIACCRSNKRTHPQPRVGSIRAEPSAKAIRSIALPRAQHPHPRQDEQVSSSSSFDGGDDDGGILLLLIRRSCSSFCCCCCCAPAPSIDEDEQLSRTRRFYCAPKESQCTQASCARVAA